MAFPHLEFKLFDVTPLSMKDYSLWSTGLEDGKHKTFLCVRISIAIINAGLRVVILALALYNKHLAFHDFSVLSAFQPCMEFILVSV